MTSVGTLRWARRTGGRLTFFDRLTLTRQAMRFRASRRDYMGKSFPPLPLEETDLDVPDTAAAKRAVSLAAKLADPYLLNHCFRSYFWATLLARVDRIKFDPELLFVAAILHDLGLTSTHAHGKSNEHCFAVTGARRAREAMQETGWSNERLDAMEEAIVLHLNVVVPLHHGPEAHLLYGGVGFDMVGGRLPELRGPRIEQVLELHPRLDHKQAVVKAVRQQCSIRPKSRIALLTKLGFERLVENAPFPS
jgi:hypothetical protein